MKYHAAFLSLGIVYSATAYILFVQASAASDQAAELLRLASEDHVWASMTDPTILPDKYFEIYAFLILCGIHLLISLLSFGALASLVIKKWLEKHKKFCTNKQRRVAAIAILIIIFIILVVVYSQFYDTAPEEVINKGVFVISMLSLPLSLASLLLAATSSNQQSGTDKYIKKQLDSIKDALWLTTVHGQIIGGCALIPKPILEKLGNPNSVTFRIQGDTIVVEGKNC